MNIIILFVTIPTSDAFCEAYWRSNISSVYSSSIGLSEPVNAISSLSYTVFGLIGIIMNNYTNMYYLIMNLSILTGVGSFFHHYYYAYTSWAYAADIIAMNVLSTFTLLYIISDNEYFKYKIVNKLLNLIIITTGIVMLVSYKINYSGIPFFRYTAYGIIVTQGILCIYFWYIKSKIKYQILKAIIWNSCLLTFGYNMWLLSNECPDWVLRNRFYSHTAWHICISWALFNTINVTNYCRYTFNEIKLTWKPLIKYIPWFLFVIVLSEEKSNTVDNYTNIELGEMKLLIEKRGGHRRVFTQ
jgi:hypothetical protein